MLGETVAIIPVKGLVAAKSRLATNLTREQRAALVVRFLNLVLVALQGSGSIARCLVVSPDRIILDRAIQAGVEAVDELAFGDAERSHGQNGALELARKVALSRDPTALLVLSVDLPFLSAGDVRSLVDLGMSAPGVVIAPDRHGQGTNALLLRPPDALRFQFGPDSYCRHRRDAEARGLRVQVFHTRGTAFDVDVPEDLADYDRQSVAVGPEPSSEDA